MVIGCEEFPRGKETEFLVKDLNNFINQNYGYSSKQVLEAFEMASTYQLYLDNKRVDPSTFGKTLSRASVGKILTAYKEHKRSKAARPSSSYLSLPEVEKKNITPAESWELVERWAKEEGEPTHYAPYLGAYEHLLSKGLVKEVKGIKSTRFVDNLNSPQRTVVQQYIKSNVL